MAQWARFYTTIKLSITEQYCKRPKRQVFPLIVPRRRNHRSIARLFVVRQSIIVLHRFLTLKSSDYSSSSASHPPVRRYPAAPTFRLFRPASLAGRADVPVRTTRTGHRVRPPSGFFTTRSWPPRRASGYLRPGYRSRELQSSIVIGGKKRRQQQQWYRVYTMIE